MKKGSKETTEPSEVTDEKKISKNSVSGGHEGRGQGAESFFQLALDIFNPVGL